MEKEDILSFIVYLLMIGVAVIVGFGVISPIFGNVSKVANMPTTTFLIISLIIGIFLQVLFYELSHVLGAKIGGYEVLSFNVLGLCWNKVYDKKKNKYVFKFLFPKDFEGLSGETIITTKKEKANPLAFVWTPFIVYIIEVLITVVLMFIIKDSKSSENPLSFIKYFMLVFITVGGMLFVYNYFPAKLDSFTDGYRLVLLSKKENINVYNMYLKVIGDSYYSKDNNEKLFDNIDDLSAITNIEILKLKIRQNKTDDIKLYIDKIIENKNKLSSQTLNIANTFKLYYLLKEKQFVIAKDFYESFNNKTKEFLKNGNSTLSVKTALLYFGIVEDSLSECETQIKDFNKAIKKEFDTNKEFEIEEFKKTIDEVNKAKPKYKLESKL